MYVNIAEISMKWLIEFFPSTLSSWRTSINRSWGTSNALSAHNRTALHTCLIDSLWCDQVVWWYAFTLVYHYSCLMCRNLFTDTHYEHCNVDSHTMRTSSVMKSFVYWCVIVFQALHVFLTSKFQGESVTGKTYDHPSWSHLQVFYVGSNNSRPSHSTPDRTLKAGEAVTKVAFIMT